MVGTSTAGRPAESPPMRSPDWQEVHAGGVVVLGGASLVGAGLGLMVVGVWVAVLGLVPRHRPKPRSTQQYVRDAQLRAKADA